MSGDIDACDQNHKLLMQYTPLSSPSMFQLATLYQTAPGGVVPVACNLVSDCTWWGGTGSMQSSSQRQLLML